MRLGFVDLNLDNFHARVFLERLRGPLRDRGFTVAGAAALDAAPSRAWADANQVPWFDDPAALNRAVDAFMILAPSNPEVHLKLCGQVFPFGKPAYVDKTFAPDLATAEQIFALADRHGTPIQTTSVLRYTSVQAAVAAAGRPVRHVTAWGSGPTFAEYGIHPLELAVSLMGHAAERLTVRHVAGGVQLLLAFDAGRAATVQFFSDPYTPFSAMVTTPADTRHLPVDDAAMWTTAVASILDFLADGRPRIDRRESLLIRRVLDAVRALAGRDGEVPLV